MRNIFLFILAIWLVIAPSVVSSEHKLNPGCLILCGGGQVPDKAIELFKSMAKEKLIVVVGTADPEIAHARYKPLFNNYIFILPELLDGIPIDKVGGLIISGGNQWDYICRLNGKRVGEIHNAGICILGNSAGSMVLGESIFTAEFDSISSEQARLGERVCIRSNFADLECLRDTIVDTHYTQRSRQGRLEVFVKASNSKVGIGIDEETALCINGDSRVILGSGTVTVVTKKSDESLLTSRQEVDTIVAGTNR